MERQEIIDGLIEVLKTVRMIDPERLVGVTEETDFLADMNVPSSQMIAIVAKVEQKFDIEFEDGFQAQIREGDTLVYPKSNNRKFNRD